MKNVKTMPQMTKPKIVEKSQVIPREARSILIEQYRARQLTGQSNNEKPNEYATGQVENTVHGDANYAGDIVRRNIGFLHRNMRCGEITRPDTAQACGTTGSGEGTTSNVTQQYYKRKTTDKNARPKQAGHFSIPSPESSHMSERAKKTYQIKKAEDSQMKKQSIQDTLERANDKRLMQSADFSETKSASFARPSDNAVKEEPFLHWENRTTQQTGKSIVEKAGIFNPKTKNVTARTAQTVRKKAAQKRSAKQAIKHGTQAAKATARFAVHVGKTVAKAATALIKGIITLIGGGGALLVIIIIAVVGALVASPFGIFFSGEDKSEKVTPVSEIVQQTNSEFASKIGKIIEDNGNIDSVKYECSGCVSSTVPNNWPDIVAVFAVKTSMDTKNGMDVVTMDAGRVAILKQTFWDMNLISSYVETIEHHESKMVNNGDSTAFEVTTITYEHILHIQITGKTAEKRPGNTALPKTSVT